MTISESPAPPKIAMLRVAVGYVQRGWRVLPLHNPTRDGGCSCYQHMECPNIGKHPRLKHGLKEATPSEAVCKVWWGEKWRGSNIGIATGARSGLVVLDEDALHGGSASLEELQRRYERLPETLKAATGGGGWHYLFAHPGGDVVIGNRTRLAGLAGLDVRGDGGYIVAAPSLHWSGAHYRWEDESIPVAECPEWLLDLIQQPAPATAAPRKETWRLPADSASFWLEKALERAVEGTRNNTGFWLACQLRDEGLGEAQAAIALEEYARGVPGQSYALSEARASVRTAYSRPAREAARSPQSANRVVENHKYFTKALENPGHNMTQNIPNDLPDQEYSEEKTLRFRFMTDTEVEQMPPPTWLIPDVLPAGRLSVMYGDFGSCKSFLALDWALCVATGSPWMGMELTYGTVAYVAGEGIGGMGPRLRAWKQHRNWTGASSLYLLNAAPQLLRPEDVAALLEGLRALPELPSLVVIDTLARSMVGGDENSAQDMGLAVAAADCVRIEFGCHVLLVHHKPTGSQKARGSTALPGAADTMIFVTRDGDSITVTCEKQKDAKEFDMRYLHKEVVVLADGSSGPYEDSLVLVPGITNHAQPMLPPSARHVLKILRSHATGITWSKLREEFMTQTGKSERTLGNALDILVDASLAAKNGNVWSPSDGLGE